MSFNQPTPGQTALPTDSPSPFSHPSELLRTAVQDSILCKTLEQQEWQLLKQHSETVCPPVGKPRSETELLEIFKA